MKIGYGGDPLFVSTVGQSMFLILRIATLLSLCMNAEDFITCVRWPPPFGQCKISVEMHLCMHTVRDANEAWVTKRKTQRGEKQNMSARPFPKRRPKEWIEALGADPGDLLLENLARIKAVARRLTRDYPALHKDIEQEIALSFLEQDSGYTARELLMIAARDAIDFMRSRKCSYSWSNEIKHFSLERMIEAGYQIDTEGNIYFKSEGNISTPVEGT